MTPTRALIEAAEAILIPMEKEIMEGGGIFSDTQFETLRAAISSAKAAEEGVETVYRIEGKRYAGSQWEVITLADPKSYEEAVHLADGWKSESPWYVAFHETRIVSREIRTTVISVREKEGL